MGGSEDVEQIQNSYYIKTGGLYDIPRIQENLRQIQTKFDGFFRKLQPNTLSDPSNIVIYNKTDDNISCVIRSGNKTKVHPSTDDTKVVLPNLILFTLENDSSNVINYGNWENFVYDDDNGGNTSLIDHYTTFVLSNIRMEYNQYVKLYEVASTFLKTSITKLREATCIQEIANCKQSLYPKKGKINENYYHKKGKINENYYHKNKTWRNLAFKIWNYTMQIIIKILNAVFLKVDINFNSDTITYEATTNFLDVKMYANIIVNHTTGERTQLDIEDSNTIAKINDNLRDTLVRHLDCMSAIKGNDGFKTQITEYTTDTTDETDKEIVNNFIKKYHTPLKYQGVFIKESIEVFKEISKEINENTVNLSCDDDNKHRIKCKICKLLSLTDSRDSTNGTISEAKVAAAKLVIFTCIRIDDYVKGKQKLERTEESLGIWNSSDGVKDDVNMRQKFYNNVQSIRDSLEFSHCVNPVRDNSLTFRVTNYRDRPLTDQEFCERTTATRNGSGRGGKRKRGGAAAAVQAPPPHHLYPAAQPVMVLPNATVTTQYPKHTQPVDNTTNTNLLVKSTNGFVASDFMIKFIQYTCFIYAVKIMRWSFYTQYKRNTDDSNNNRASLYGKMFVDYSISMMLSLFLHATKQHILMYAVLIDEIASVVLLMKTENPDVLLIPYFIASLGITK